MFENAMLIDNLGSDDFGIRRRAAEELGRRKAKEGTEPLIKALGDEKWDVRKAAAISLGEIGDRKVVGPLKDALGDKDWFVREAAAAALGKLGDRSAGPALARAAKDQVYSVQQAATRAMEAIRYEETVETEKAEVSSLWEEMNSDLSTGAARIAAELKAKAEVDANGFLLEISVGENRRQKVRVDVTGKDHDGSPLIVFSTVCGPASSANYEYALRQNASLPYGGIAVRDVEGKPHFVLINTQLGTSAQKEELIKSIWFLATRGDEIEMGLTGKDVR